LKDKTRLSASKSKHRSLDKSISLDDRNPLVYAERGLAHQTQGQNGEAQKDFERGLKLNNDLRLMLDLHLLDLQMQIKEMRRRQAAIQRNIARLTLGSRPGAGFPRRAVAA
jgi:tetratricopeptide (TPR) repeat protein